MISKYQTVDHVSDSADATARNCAEWLCAQALASTGRFAICCSGGSTPKAMYQYLAEPELASRFPWKRVHWFWGDERFVAHDDPDSNYGMINAALFSRVAVPVENIHEVPTTDFSPKEAAAGYEEMLKAYRGSGKLDEEHPLFDVNLLGIGADGHTASLFPNDPALDERRRWALAVTGGLPALPRITLTYPVLNNSRDVVFIVSGEKKQSIVARVRAGDLSLPAVRIAPLNHLHWFADRASVSAELNEKHSHG